VINLNDQTDKSKQKKHKKHDHPKMAQTVMFSPLRVPVLSSGLMKTWRPVALQFISICGIIFWHER